MPKAAILDSSAARILSLLIILLVFFMELATNIKENIPTFIIVEYRRVDCKLYRASEKSRPRSNEGIQIYVALPIGKD